MKLLFFFFIDLEKLYLPVIPMKVASVTNTELIKNISKLWIFSLIWFDAIIWLIGRQGLILIRNMIEQFMFTRKKSKVECFRNGSENFVK